MCVCGRERVVGEVVFPFVGVSIRKSVFFVSPHGVLRCAWGVLGVCLGWSICS